MRLVRMTHQRPKIGIQVPAHSHASFNSSCRRHPTIIAGVQSPQKILLGYHRQSINLSLRHHPQLPADVLAVSDSSHPACSSRAPHLTDMLFNLPLSWSYAAVLSTYSVKIRQLFIRSSCHPFQKSLASCSNSLPKNTLRDITSCVHPCLR